MPQGLQDGEQPRVRQDLTAVLTRAGAAINQSDPRSFIVRKTADEVFRVYVPPAPGGAEGC